MKIDEKCLEESYNIAQPKTEKSFCFPSHIIVFRHLTVVSVSFWNLIKGITSNMCKLCFVLINSSILLKLLCVWILFYNASSHFCLDFCHKKKQFCSVEFCPCTYFPQEVNHMWDRVELVDLKPSNTEYCRFALRYSRFAQNKGPLASGLWHTHRFCCWHHLRCCVIPKANIY